MLKHILLSSLCATGYLTLMAGLAAGQQSPETQRRATTADNVFTAVDENGVDQLSGHLVEKQTVLSIGNPDRPLSLEMDYSTAFGGNFVFTSRNDYGSFFYPPYFPLAQAHTFDGYLSASGDEFGNFLGAASNGQSVSYFNACGSPESNTANGDGHAIDSDDDYDCFGYEEDTQHDAVERSEAVLGKTGSVWWVIEPGGRYAEYGEVDTPWRFPGPPSIFHMTKLGYPDGREVAIYRNPETSRIRHVVSNDGYQLVFFYGDAPMSGPASQRPSKVVAINRTQVYCDPEVDGCAADLTGWPTYAETHDANLSQITSILPGGETIRRSFDGSHTEKPFVARTDLATGTTDLSATWAPYSQRNIFNRHVTQVTRDGVTTGYARYVKGEIVDCRPGTGRVDPNTWDDGVVERLIKNYPDGTSSTLYFDQCNARYQKYVNPVGQTHLLDSRRYFGIIDEAPSGYVKYPGTAGYNGTAFPAFGPRADGIYVRTAGSGAGWNNASLLTKYDYRPAFKCAWAVNWNGSPSAAERSSIQQLMTQCTLPIGITDARGNKTQLTYDPSHGGITDEMQPSVGGVSPEKRFYYDQRYAWIKNAGGGYSQAESPIWLKTEELFCRTSAMTSDDSCAAGEGDLVVTTYDYGPDSGPNNLLLRGVVMTADGQSRRTCYGYDRYGNRTSEIKPNAGLENCP